MILLRNTLVKATVCLVAAMTFSTAGVGAFLSSSPSPSLPSLLVLKFQQPVLVRPYHKQASNWFGIRSRKSPMKVSTVDIEEASLAEKVSDEREDSISRVTNLEPDWNILSNMDDSQTKELTRKIINGIFLAAAFGYALFTILNIDHEITRGWTQSEIAMRIPLDNWSNYESSLESKPVFTKTLINVIIYLLGDWLSQTAFQGKNVLDFDVARTLRNGFIGLCFGPLVHQYYEFSDSILPVEGGIMNRVEKIFMDQTIYLTVKCSIYISAVGLLQGDDWPTVKQNVKDRIGGIVLTAWKFWPLVHCITYTLIPARHRILWVNSVDLIWNAILATQVTKEKEPAKEPDLVPILEATESLLATEQVVDNSEQLLQEVVQSLSHDEQLELFHESEISSVQNVNVTATSM